MKIVWPEETLNVFQEMLQNLAGIAGKEYAIKLAGEINSRISELELFPALGKKLPGYNNERLRVLIHNEYKIIYKMEPEEVFILGIYHSRLNDS